MGTPLAVRLSKVKQKTKPSVLAVRNTKSRFGLWHIQSEAYQCTILCLLETVSINSFSLYRGNCIHKITTKCGRIHEGGKYNLQILADFLSIWSPRIISLALPLYSWSRNILFKFCLSVCLLIWGKMGKRRQPSWNGLLVHVYSTLYMPPKRIEWKTNKQTTYNLLMCYLQMYII